MSLIIGIHDISSGHRLIEITKVIDAYKKHVKMVVISRATGAAAQYGLAEASKTFYKLGIRLLILPDIQDYKEFFPQTKIIQLTKTYKQRALTKGDLSPDKNRDILVLLSANDNGFSKNELLEEAEKVYLENTEKELPTEALLGIILYEAGQKSSQ